MSGASIVHREDRVVSQFRPDWQSVRALQRATVVALPAHAVVGEYVGALRCDTPATDLAADRYAMRYPDIAGELRVTAREGGSVARFVNHAPTGSAANNCTCWAVLVDGAYHICVVTARPVLAREELAYDYGDGFWAARRARACGGDELHEGAAS